MTALSPQEMTESQFRRISDMVKSLCGINLHDGKKELVKARLSKRLRSLGVQSFDDYIDHLAQDGGQELVSMLDAVSTNLTYFFREPKHLEHLSRGVLPDLVRRNAASRRIRIWSAGCSSGEEPYTLAIVVRETLGEMPGWDIRILATDLSTRVLAAAREAVYDPQRLRDVPPGVVGSCFTKVPGQGHWLYRVRDDLRRMVTLVRLNLMEAWPMRGPFDVIFCRNVMIYFDKATQGKLVQRFHDILAPGGRLFIGHSESLTGINHCFQYVQPTVYRKA